MLSWLRDHRARPGICPTPPDHALCSRRVRAPSIQRGCERAPSRGVVNAGGMSKRSACRWAAIAREGARCSRRCVPPYHMSEDACRGPSVVAHCGGLGAPRATWLKAPPRVAVSVGGWCALECAMVGNLERCLVAATPTPLLFYSVPSRNSNWSFNVRFFHTILENTLGHCPLPLVRRWGAPPPP